MASYELNFEKNDEELEEEFDEELEQTTREEALENFNKNFLEIVKNIQNPNLEFVNDFIKSLANFYGITIRDRANLGFVTSIFINNINYFVEIFSQKDGIKKILKESFYNELLKECENSESEELSGSDKEDENYESESGSYEESSSEYEGEDEDKYEEKNEELWRMVSREFGHEGEFEKEIIKLSSLAEKPEPHCSSASAPLRDSQF